MAERQSCKESFKRDNQFRNQVNKMNNSPKETFKQQLIIKIIHIVLEFVAFICCLVAVCDDNHNNGCFHKHGWQWPFAFATCCIRYQIIFINLLTIDSLIWWIFSIILGFCKCCSWGGQSTFVRDQYSQRLPFSNMFFLKRSTNNIPKRYVYVGTPLPLRLCILLGWFSRQI